MLMEKNGSVLTVCWSRVPPFCPIHLAAYPKKEKKKKLQRGSLSTAAPFHPHTKVHMECLLNSQEGPVENGQHLSGAA